MQHISTIATYLLTFARNNLASASAKTHSTCTPLASALFFALPMTTYSNVEDRKMTELSQFVYETVSAREIRVLTPDSASPDAGLSWSLRKANVDDLDLRFIALSYSWGVESQTFPIYCNGLQLQVHRNLYTALPFLARRFEAGRSTAIAYWIDAICINQTDDEEKRNQIRLMNTIYRRADHVLIWLGLAPEPQSQDLMPRAIQLLPLLVKETARSRDLSLKSTRDFEVDHELSHLGPGGWEAILHLLRNNYFTRTWIAQEIALAKEIVFLCGDHEIDPDLVETAVVHGWNVRKWATYDPETSERMALPRDGYADNVLFLIRGIINYSGEEGNAHQTIRIANLLTSQACFAPQDRVLGILGMVEEDFGAACEDLHTYTSIPDLYTRFSTLVFEASGLTKVHWWFYLSMAFNKQRMDGLPSWVPDLHQNGLDAKRQPYESMLTARVYSDPPWQASSKPRKAAHGSRSGEILLRGKLLDEVSVVHPEVPAVCRTFETDLAWLETMVELIEWESKLADSILNDATEELRISEETYRHTLLAGSCGAVAMGAPVTREIWLRFWESGQRLLRVVQRYDHLRSTACTDQLSVPNTMTDDEQAAASCFRDSKDPLALFAVVLGFTRDHQMFSTKQGRFGFTCTGVQPGDVVCVFNDSVSPFVLRRVNEGDGMLRYKFVGDAYVHDLMYGEADGMDVTEEDVRLV